MDQSDALKQQIAALDVILAELDHYYAITPGEIESQKIFQQKLMVGDVRYLKKKQLDDLLAQPNDDDALKPSQIQELQDILGQLDKYVRNDQAVSMGVSYLLQLA